METTKSAPSMKGFWNSFEEFKAEFTRTQWSEEGYVTKTAWVVVISIFVAGLVLYGADLFLRGSLHGLHALFRGILG